MRIILRAVVDVATCGMAERLLAGLKQRGAALFGAVSNKRGRTEPVDVLLVGLHNPGSQYAGTRHNAGAMGLERLAAEWEPTADWSRQDGASVARGVLGGASVLAVLPDSFMNLSGRSVAALARRHGVPPSSVCVVHDDLDLESGRVKLKIGGSSGGHRGLNSCESSLGDAGFWRLRIGIGRPEDRSRVSEYVLEAFAPDELDTLRGALDRIAALSPTLPRAIGGDPRARQGWSFAPGDGQHAPRAKPRAARPAGADADADVAVSEENSRKRATRAPSEGAAAGNTARSGD